MTWRFFSVLAGGVTLFAACGIGHEVDLEGYCRLDPGHPDCAGFAGGGGVAGVGGTAGMPMQGAAGMLMGSGGGGTGGSGSGGMGGMACDPPKTDCSGKCVELASDAANCGECGYACGGEAACSEGACAAEAVVAGVTAPYAFVLDAERVYFVTPVRDGANALPPAVRQAPRGGGGPVEAVFGDGLNFRARSLALADGTLFFGDLDNGGLIRKGPLNGSGVSVHVAGQPAVQQLVAAEGRLWWSTTGGDTSRLRRALAAGDGVTADELLPPPQFHTGRVGALVAEGSPAALYWVNRDASAFENKGGLWRKAEGGGAALLVAGGQMVALAVSAEATWVADATTGIGKAGKEAPTTLTPVVSATDVGGSVQGLAVAGTRLYWLAFNAGQLELHRSGLDGSGARVLGRVAAKSATYWEAPIGPSQLTVDGGFVYFSDPGTVTGNTSVSNPGLEGVTGAADGAIYRLPE